MLCGTAGDGHAWQSGGNSKRCYMETESRDAKDRMQKPFSSSCWGEREIN